MSPVASAPRAPHLSECLHVSETQSPQLCPVQSVWRGGVCVCGVCVWSVCVECEEGVEGEVGVKGVECVEVWDM